MKLRLEATPTELEEKSGDLIKAVADIIEPVAPDMSEALVKALPRKETALKYPVLRELQRQTEAAYDKTIEVMLKKIGKVLDRGFEKSEKSLEKAGPFIGPRGGKWADPQHTTPWKEPTTKPAAKPSVPWNKELAKRPLYHGGKKKITKIDPVKLQTRDPGFYGEGFYVTGNKDHAKTYGGRITTMRLDPDAKVLGPYGLNAKTINRELQAKVKEWLMGEPYERAKARGKGDTFLEFVEMINPDSPEFNPLEWKNQAWGYSKAMGADVHFAAEGEIVIINLGVADIVQKSEADQAEPLTSDHTKAIADHDDIAYRRVKQVLVGKGYEEVDFDEGGPLYGWSTNQLIDLAKDKRAG